MLRSATLSSLLKHASCNCYSGSQRFAINQFTRQLDQQFSSLSLRKVLPALSVTVPSLLQQPCREYAARKGTRARKEAKKVKKEEVKKVVMNRRDRKLQAIPYKNQRPFDDSHYPLPVDDVYFYRKFQSKKWPFEEALQNLRETHHPSVYNVPNAPLYLRVNLDLKYPNRATKVMDGWKSVVGMNSPFLLEGMTTPPILAFCVEDTEYIDNVIQQGGVEVAGGKELIKSIQSGDVNTEEFEYIIAHPTIVPELTVIRGVIKRKFPSIKTRTIGVDLVEVANRLKSGIKVQVVKNEKEPDFGYIETPIGTLNMDGLYDNFVSILADTVARRVNNKPPSEFVIGCVLKTPGNGFEEFKVDLEGVLEEAVARKQAEFSEH